LSPPISNRVWQTPVSFTRTNLLIQSSMTVSPRPPISSGFRAGQVTATHPSHPLVLPILLVLAPPPDLPFEPMASPDPDSYLLESLSRPDFRRPKRSRTHIDPPQIQTHQWHRANDRRRLRCLSAGSPRPVLLPIVS
jgi:hypothetical protein